VKHKGKDKEKSMTDLERLEIAVREAEKLRKLFEIRFQMLVDKIREVK